MRPYRCRRRRGGRSLQQTIVPQTCFFQVDMICDVSKFGGMFYLTSKMSFQWYWYHLVPFHVDFGKYCGMVAVNPYLKAFGNTSSTALNPSPMKWNNHENSVNILSPLNETWKSWHFVARLISFYKLVPTQPQLGSPLSSRECTVFFPRIWNWKTKKQHPSAISENSNYFQNFQ